MESTTTDHDLFAPIQSRSLKDIFIERFEALILSGKFKPGERVPSERELGALFNVSRPVVHEGLRTLEGRGLVTIESRKGVRVNDYRKEGSIEMLLSILNYSGGKLSPELMNGVLEMRLLFEVETARLAAIRRTSEQLSELSYILDREQALQESENTKVINNGNRFTSMIQLDYDFHLAVALASGNEIYPLLLNSFKGIYRHILEIFYSQIPTIVPILDLHKSIVNAIRDRDEDGAKHAMERLLEYGESNLRTMITPS